MIFGSRWLNFFGVNDTLRCPNGHRFAVMDMWSDERDLICSHKGANGVSDCDRRLWVIGGAFRIHGKAQVIVCEISAEEMRYLKSSRLDADGTLNYLGMRLDYGETG